MPGHVHRPGRIGVVSRSGTLTYEAVKQLSVLGLGQSTAVGIGGDPVHGTDFVDCLARFEQDPDTVGVIMIGEIGGPEEARGAAFVKENMTKPVVGFIAGRTAPPGRRMGHAGAVISGGADTAEAKIEILRQSGITVCDGPHVLGQTMHELLARRRRAKSERQTDHSAPAQSATQAPERVARNGAGASRTKGAGRAVTARPRGPVARRTNVRAS